MKKLFLILIIVLLAISNIFSQEQDAGNAAHSATIKWAPATLVAGKVTIGSEYNFGGKGSVDLMIGIPVTMKKTITYDDKQSDLDTKAFSVLLGYRYYFGRKPMRGFYVEPYAKYLRHESEGIISSQLSDLLAQMDTKTRYEGFGAGAQLGVQFIILKRISLDLYFLGIEANTAKFSSHSVDIANALPWTFVQSSEARHQLEDAVDKVPFVSDKIAIEIDQDKKEANTSFSGFLPGLRFGASIGIRF